MKVLSEKRPGREAEAGTRASAESTSSSLRCFYRIAAGCCCYYVAAQVLQKIAVHLGVNDFATGEAEILQRLTFLDQLRLAAVLLSFSLIPILAAYSGVVLRRYRLRLAPSLLGFAFSLIFVSSEAAARSIDLFLVSKKWSAAYQVARDPGVRAAISGRILEWDETVGAFYYALLAAHLLSSVCFALATWDRESWWNRVVALGFMATTAECASRLAEGYLGQSWLVGINYAAYFPIVVLNFGSLTVWLWREASTFRSA